LRCLSLRHKCYADCVNGVTQSYLTQLWYYVLYVYTQVSKMIVLAVHEVLFIDERMCCEETGALCAFLHCSPQCVSLSSSPSLNLIILCTLCCAIGCWICDRTALRCPLWCSRLLCLLLTIQLQSFVCIQARVPSLTNGDECYECPTLCQSYCGDSTSRFV